MFYTKYRPQKFSEISKPNEVAESLMTQVKNGKVSHAYLFVGSRGTGKTTTARILAKALNCKKPLVNGDPCDRCDNCAAIKSGNFMDLIEIDAASNRGIDDIRDLKDKIRLSPSIGKRKVYIIDEVHMLTNEAFNALLKTLEEPPAHVNFILCTTEAHKVPDTIKSRCQVFKFKRATVSQLVEKLTKIVKNEDADISKEVLKKIAQSSLGGFRDAETLLQQVIEGNLNVDSLSNLGSKQNYIDFVDYLIVKDAGSAFRTINKIFDEGIDLYVWTGELLKYLRDLLFISVSADEGMVDTTDELYEPYEETVRGNKILGNIKDIRVFNEGTKRN
jgi:DNA polymerase-3 subunit gamma/tau